MDEEQAIEQAVRLIEAMRMKVEALTIAQGTANEALMATLVRIGQELDTIGLRLQELEDRVRELERGE